MVPDEPSWLMNTLGWEFIGMMSLMSHSISARVIVLQYGISMTT